jgi:hypothetical protein
LGRFIRQFSGTGSHRGRLESENFNGPEVIVGYIDEHTFNVYGLNGGGVFFNQGWFGPAAGGIGSLTDSHYGEDFSKYPDYTWEWKLVGGAVINNNQSGIFFHNQQRNVQQYAGSLY